jgi:hypothetical protein
MVKTETRTPALGDPVVRNGETHTIIRFGGQNKRDEFARGIVDVEAFEDAIVVAFENDDFLYKALARDLRWNDDLGAWYSWGTLLSDTQKLRVAIMRDVDELPAREGRRKGSGNQVGDGPAPGEHLNLYLALFHGGGQITDERIADYRERYALKLVDGYADPDANDSEGAIDG